MLTTLMNRIGDRNVVRVYWATLGLGVAYGMAIAVISVFLDKHGYHKTEIGSLAAWFALGLVAASLPAGQLIARISAKWTLVLGLSTYALTVLSFPLVSGYAAIALLRFVDGAASISVWIASETIILARGRRENKAFITSLYAMSIAIGYITGPVLAHASTGWLDVSQIFMAAGVLSLLVALYVALRLDTGLDAAPAENAASASSERAPVGELFGRIKVSCFATFAYGYFQSSVVLFLPIFLIHGKGIAERDTLLIPAFFAGGMLMFSNVAGRLGDQHGHLLVMRALATIGTCTVGAFVWLESFSAMCAAVFVAGLSLASVSPLSLALQGLQTREHGRATSIYNACYACGMLMGPPLSGHIFEHSGGGAMLYHLAGLWALFVGFSIVFRHDDPRAAQRVQPDLRASAGLIRASQQTAE
jgi:MFS family permease